VYTEDGSTIPPQRVYAQKHTHTIVSLIVALIVHFKLQAAITGLRAMFRHRVL
jgi:hypothetical protein